MTDRVRCIIAVGIVACCAVLSPASSAQNQSRDKTCRGGYVGDLQMSAKDDGRTFELIAPYGYEDQHCELWMVPAHATVDGASIPQIFWSFLGGPYEGKYRNASVIHDWFCDRRNMPWERVHRVFYEAMLTSGVEAAKAKLMYLAVYYGGPRWDEQAVLNNRLVNKSLPPASIGIDPEMLNRYRKVHFARESGLSAGVRFIADRINHDDIDIGQIDRLAEQARAIDKISDAELPPLR